jgi:hypothetical protein
VSHFAVASRHRGRDERKHGRREKGLNPLCDGGNHEARRNDMTAPFPVASGTAALGHSAVRRGGELRRCECHRRKGESLVRRARR